MQPWNEDAFVNRLFSIKQPPTTNITCSSQYIYESNEIRITRLIAESFLVLVGFVFNVIICALNLKHSNINAAIRIYIRNMAVADMGVLVLGFPFAVAKEQEATGKWLLGGIACRYLYPVTDMFYAVAIWSVVAIAMERCHIMRSNIHSWNSGSSRSIRVVLVLWITAFVTVSVPLFFVSNYKSSCGKMYCFIRWPTASNGNNLPPTLHSLFLLCSLYILPIVLVVVSYCRLAYGYRHVGVCNTEGGVSNRRQRLRSDNSENTNTSLFSELDEARQQECDNAKRFLSPLLILLLINIIPMIVLRSIFVFKPQKLSLENYLVLLNISIMLTVCNSAARPFVYYMVSEDVRDGYTLLVNKVKRALHMCCREYDETTEPLHDSVTMIRHSKTNYKETTL